MLDTYGEYSGEDLSQGDFHGPEQGGSIMNLRTIQHNSEDFYPVRVATSSNVLGLNSVEP